MDIIDRITMLLNGREQQELTNYLNLKSVAFSEWKSGKSKSYRKYLIEIAEFFDVSIDYLVYGKEKNSAPELSETDYEMLALFKQLTPIDKGKEIGRIENIIENYTPEQREAL